MSISNKREKAIRLLDYLTKLAWLRAKIIRDVSEYDHVLWIHGIPHEPGCYARAWEQKEEYEPDVWIEVKGTREPKLPEVPGVCRDWIDRETIEQTNVIPQLFPEITRQVPNRAWQEGSSLPPFVGKKELLDDHPEVRREMGKYLEQNWNPWAEEHRKWEEVHNVYSKLFSIHQEQQRLGEQYELVIGLGLLTWRTPQNQSIRRHLVVAKATLEFEPKLGKFTVRPDPEGSQLSPELDMLEADQQPAHAEQKAKENLREAEDDPWDLSCIEAVLNSLVHSIHPGGEYYGHLKPEAVASTTRPIVEYAPAIILRKRSVRGLTEVLKSIKKKIETGAEIPFGFCDLAEMIDIRDESGRDDTQEPQSPTDDEIYFPKPSNEEQRRIVNKVQTSNGVLVQGPPGTGKSHTIANLVCHLLAKGQRLLITAKTPRALQVLHKLLPEEIRPLCVSLISSGSDERDDERDSERSSLDHSIRAILDHHDRWNPLQVLAETKELESELSELRKEKAGLEKRRRAIRESESHSQQISGGAYQGTAAQIAIQINRERAQYDWFTDVAPFDLQYPYSNEDFVRLLGVLRGLTDEKRLEYKQSLPDALPAPQEFQNLITAEKEANMEAQRTSKDKNEELFQALQNQSETHIRFLHQELHKLHANLQRLRSSREWATGAVYDVLSGKSGVWRKRKEESERIVSEITPFISKADSKLDLPENSEIVKILQDAKELREHCAIGGKLGWFIFRPAVVRHNLYIIKDIRVDGMSCNSVDRLDSLIYGLTCAIEMRRVRDIWKTFLVIPEGLYSFQLESLKSEIELLRQVLDLQSDADKCENILRLCAKAATPNWSDEDTISKYISTCSHALAVKKEHEVANKLEDIAYPIASVKRESDPHPVASELLSAIRGRDIDNYICAFRRVETLRSEKESARWADSFVSKLRVRMPQLADRISKNPGEATWEERISLLPKAWYWAQAQSWLNDYIRKEDVPSLERRIRQIEESINSRIAQISSNLAWKFCFERLRDEHRKYMEAWSMAMNKARRKYSKYVARYRREAQGYLDKCREAVPAWIMPLHRIWDTVDPTPGMFELIIVDEASQCGPEAFPLFYLGKKVLIVGDDKQISPEAVGVLREAMHRLMDEYLYDFAFKSCFDVESSLFDHGKLRYGAAHVVLREHFRCMPEIIRFSNELCYSIAPLIPLRQYPPDRLPPLRTVYVSEGYREGTGSGVFNHLEAKKVVDTIVECCGDSKYAGRTMGVITLQGDRQARKIEEMLLPRLGAEELSKRRLICGEPYSFQGDERDIIFLSMVAAPNETIRSLRGPADERRFNVAVSRARDQVWLFHSCTRNDLSKICLRYRLLEFFEESKLPDIAGLNVDELRKTAHLANRSNEKAPPPFDSWFEVDVALEIAGKGYRVVPQFNVAGYYIDLVVEGGLSRLAVECDGDEVHGIDEYEKDMQRQRMLERCGWVFYRVRAGAFRYDRQEALSRLWQMLEDRGIFPEKQQVTKTPQMPIIPLVAEDKVQIGDTVVYMFIDEPDNIREAQISRGPSSPDFGIINIDTPIAQALINTKIGDRVKARLPKGTKTIKVIDIKKG